MQHCLLVRHNADWATPDFVLNFSKSLFKPRISIRTSRTYWRILSKLYGRRPRHGQLKLAKPTLHIQYKIDAVGGRGYTKLGAGQLGHGQEYHSVCTLVYDAMVADMAGIDADIIFGASSRDVDERQLARPRKAKTQMAFNDMF